MNVYGQITYPKIKAFQGWKFWYIGTSLANEGLSKSHFTLKKKHTWWTGINSRKGNVWAKVLTISSVRIFKPEFWAGDKIHKPVSPAPKEGHFKIYITDLQDFIWQCMLQGWGLWRWQKMCFYQFNGQGRIWNCILNTIRLWPVRWSCRSSLTSFKFPMS